MALKMTRAELKKMVGRYRPSLVRPEMMETVTERKLVAARERINLRHERALRALYLDRSLNDEQRWTRWSRLADRKRSEMEKLEPLERRSRRIFERAMVKFLSETA